MPDRQDRQNEINLNGRRQIPKLYSGIPAPFVVKSAMDAVNLEMGNRPNVTWLSDDAVRGFTFRKTAGNGQRN